MLSFSFIHVYVHSHVLFLSMHQCGQLESSYFCHLIFDYFYKDLAAFFMSKLFISCSIWLPFQCLMCMVFCCNGIIFIHLSFLHTPEFCGITNVDDCLVFYAESEIFQPYNGSVHEDQLMFLDFVGHHYPQMYIPQKQELS